jgi:hypothetical protein
MNLYLILLEYKRIKCYNYTSAGVTIFKVWLFFILCMFVNNLFFCEGAMLYRNIRSSLWQTLVAIANRGKPLFLVIIANYVVCAIAYGIIEGKGFIASMWWATVTGFTVGYGDQYPQTTAGRGVGEWLIVSSWILSLCAAALITATLVQNRDEFSHEEQEWMKASLVRIENALGIDDQAVEK